MMGSVKEASHAQYTPQPVSFSLFESLSCALPERDTCFYPQCLVLTIHLPGTERPGWKHHVCQLFPACCTVFWRLTSLAVDQQCPRATGKVASSILCSGFSLSSLLWVFCRSASASSPTQPGCPNPSKNLMLWHFLVSTSVSLAVLPEPPSLDSPSLD